MKMKLFIISSVLALSGITTSVIAGKYGDQAIAQLEKAIESAKSGDNKTSAAYAEKAKKNLILENRKHPYPESTKKITGESQKQEHDDAAFSEINKAESDLKKGNAKEAAQDEQNAETDIKQKEQTK